MKQLPNTPQRIHEAFREAIHEYDRIELDLPPWHIGDPSLKMAMDLAKARGWDEVTTLMFANVVQRRRILELIEQLQEIQDAHPCLVRIVNFFDKNKLP